MSQAEEHQKNLPQTNQKPHNEDHEEEASSLSEQYYFNDGYDENDDIDPQETYLFKLKEQRKRIQDLSFTVENYKYKYQEQVKRSRYLEAQLSKHQISKISTIRYEQINTRLQSIQEQNVELRETVQKLRRQNMDLTSDLASKISKQEKEFNSQRKKDQARIQALNQKFSDKQEEYEKLQKELRKKEKEIVELTNSFNSKTKKIAQQYEEKIISQSRKIEIAQQKNQSNQINLIQQSLAQLQRQNCKLRQQNNCLKDQLQQQQKWFESQAEKSRMKLGRLKKKFDEKEKECDQFKSALNKVERERKDFSSEKEQIINMSSKKQQEFTIRITSMQTSFNNQKKILKAQIERHEKTIQGLIQIKRDCFEKIKELQLIIKRKQEHERHRRSMLKSEMKEIDKLQKVIDKIVQ